MPLTPSLRHCSNKYMLARVGEKDKEKESLFFIFFTFRMKSSSVERDKFSVVTWRLTGIQHSGWGWEDHSTSQEWWMRMFWRVILSLSVMVPQGVAHLQISDFWRGCRFVIVSRSRWVLGLWLFYMQASVSWTGWELQLVASARRQREV